MPKRTNEFQRLVFLIHQALAGKNATVTESAMVAVPGDDEPREVDVLIETDAAPYRVKIAVEAKDHKRPLSVDVVEAIFGKYRTAGGVIVDKIVVICRNGYTRKVRKRAEALGIQLFELSKVSRADLEGAIQPDRARRGTFTMEHLEVDLDGYSGPPSELLKSGRIVCAEHGADKGSLVDSIAKAIAKSAKDQDGLLEEMQRSAVGMSCRQVKTPYYKGLRAKVGDTVYSFREVRCHIHFHPASFIPVDTYQMKGDGMTRNIVYGKAECMGGTVEVLMPDGIESKSFSVNFHGCKIPVRGIRLPI